MEKVRKAKISVVLEVDGVVNYNRVGDRRLGKDGAHIMECKKLSKMDSNGNVSIYDFTSDDCIKHHLFINEMPNHDYAAVADSDDIVDIMTNDAILLRGILIADSSRQIGRRGISVSNAISKIGFSAAEWLSNNTFVGTQALVKKAGVDGKGSNSYRSFENLGPRIQECHVVFDFSVLELLTLGKHESKAEEIAKRLGCKDGLAGYVPVGSLPGTGAESGLLIPEKKMFQLLENLCNRIALLDFSQASGSMKFKSATISYYGRDNKKLPIGGSINVDEDGEPELDLNLDSLKYEPFHTVSTRVIGDKPKAEKNKKVRSNG